MNASIFIAAFARPFKRQFNLADYVQVRRRFRQRLLKIELVREIPEAMKPRRIAIDGQTSAPTQKIETVKAA